MMTINTLTALSPIDGRYAHKVAALRPLLSEYGLIYHRVIVEIRWLQALANEPLLTEVPAFSPAATHYLENIISEFSLADAERIKSLEQTTNHDVKAIEYFLKERLSEHPELCSVTEFVHFCCTSEDINNLAYALMLKHCREQHLLPQLRALCTQLQDCAQRYAHQPMLSHTHGQAASPTTVGKEFANFYVRLNQAIETLTAITIRGKFNGATGNFNAHTVAYPEIDWPTLCAHFVTDLQLSWNLYTTQIEPHDYIAQLAHALIHINNILIDFNRDMWGYIALGYFQQQPVAHEIGSSTMPHKINPIDFENSEGNLAIANAVLSCLANRLPISRWQRDLVDSTLLRNLGVGIAHSLIAYLASMQGLAKSSINVTVLQDDLQHNWAVLAEALQTVMRRYGVEQPYEQLKQLTRGKAVDQHSLHRFIDDLTVPESVKQTLKQLTPANYIGKATELAARLHEENVK